MGYSEKWVNLILQCVNWMSWSRLSKHKSTRGMGFRDFKDFNIALLGKQ